MGKVNKGDAGMINYYGFFERMKAQRIENDRDIKQLEKQMIKKSGLSTCINLFRFTDGIILCCITHCYENVLDPNYRYEECLFINSNELSNYIKNMSEKCK